MFGFLEIFLVCVHERVRWTKVLFVEEPSSDGVCSLYEFVGGVGDVPDGLGKVPVEDGCEGAGVEVDN